MGVELGWCQLRQLPIHPELVQDLWCHHWTARPPRLPVMAPQGAVALTQAKPNHQLSLGIALEIGRDIGLPSKRPSPRP